jgi:hypothetical protein
MTPDEAVERQAMRTKAPILSRWSRIVLQVAVANWVCLRPIRRKAHTRRVAQGRDRPVAPIPATVRAIMSRVRPMMRRS